MMKGAEWVSKGAMKAKTVCTRAQLDDEERRPLLWFFRKSALGRRVHNLTLVMCVVSYNPGDQWSRRLSTPDPDESTE